LERNLGQLTPVGGIGSIATEGKETVQLRAVQLDMRGGLQVSSDQTQQITILDQLWQELLHTRQHPVVLGLRDRLVQIVQPPLKQPGELLAFRLAVQHRLEGPTPDIGISHARVGELPDISRDSVELLKRQ